MSTRTKPYRVLVLLLVGALLWSLLGGSAEARTMRPAKDQKFLAMVEDVVADRLASSAGTRFEVNETGVRFATFLLQDPEVASSLLVQAKQICRRLNATTAKGAKAVRAEARRLGTDAGTSDREALEAIDADPSFSEDDKFSMGIVVGLIAGASFASGVQVYCPRHNKQVSVLTQSWTAALGG